MEKILLMSNDHNRVKLIIVNRVILVLVGLFILFKYLSLRY